MPATPSSFTSSSEAAWRRFLAVLLGTSVGLLVLGYVLVLVIDPYDILAFSPNFDRAPVDKQQRFFYPALARKGKFDSAIIGTSNVRLLEPALLNPLFHSAFVNLAMNAASAYEQSIIFHLFRRHHAEPKTLIFGIDYVWCYEDAFQKFLGANRPSDFPQWMYDEDPYNDLPPLSSYTFKHAWRQLLYVSGLKTFKYGADGYTDFTWPMERYDLRKARMNIYGSPEPVPKRPVMPPVQLSAEQMAAMKFPALPLLDAMLSALPDSTTRILMFVPYHYYFQPAAGSELAIRWGECKRRVTELASAYPNAHVLDFMIESPITTRDANYWDHKHYTLRVAETLPALIARGALTEDDDPNFVRLFPASDKTGASVEVAHLREGPPASSRP